MAKKLKEQEEKFAVEIVKGGHTSNTDAYRACFDTGGWSNEKIHVYASRLMKRPEVRARIEELQNELREQSSITLADHLDQLKKIRDLAKKNKQFNTAARAEELRGKTQGFYVDRHEIQDERDPRKMSDKDMVFALASQGTPLAAAELARNVGLVGFNTEGDQAFIAELNAVSPKAAETLCQLIGLDYSDTLKAEQESDPPTVSHAPTENTTRH